MDSKDMTEATQGPGQGVPGLGRLAFIFLRLGAIGFGGGIAMIALMEQECVQWRRCVETEEFLHGVGLGQILGSFPVNTAFFIGYRMYGLPGALVASIAFLIPSLVLVILLAGLYFSFRQIPSLQGVLAGLGPVVIALITNAAWSMGRKSVRSPLAGGIVIVAVLGSLLRVNPLVLLGAAGGVGYWRKLSRKPAPSGLAGPRQRAVIPWLLSLPALPPVWATLVGTQAPVVTVGLLSLATQFLKVGLVFFGGGFVLVPVLNQLLVQDLGWLTQQEFIDGVAISQLTPGPIAVLATFAGYRVGDIPGALVATAGLFLPSLVVMFLVCHFYARLRHLQPVKDFLAGINPAVVGMIISAAVTLAPSAFPWQQPWLGLISVGLFMGSVFLLVRWKWHPALVLAVGAVTGVLSGYIPQS